MKRTLIDPKSIEIPTPFGHFFENARVFDSSCSPEARVYYIEKGNGYYLKVAPRGALLREAEMTRYFHGKGLAAEVVEYLSFDKDYLLTARVSGEDCTHADHLAEPERLCDLLATKLRELHETSYADCPVQDRMTEYLQTVDRNYERGVFDASYLPTHLRHLSALDAHRLVAENRHRLQNDTLLHGDYCLPNVMLDDWRLSAFIDLGNGGVGDRHIDLFWGVWTLEFNLKTPRYGSRFLDAYGRDRVDGDLLTVIAAAECFG